MQTITLTPTKDTKNTRRFQGKNGDLDATVYVQLSNDLSKQESITLVVGDVEVAESE